MRPCALALALFLTPSLASAETPLGAEDFDALVTGKTITYGQFGDIFGIEEYLADRKVRWSVAPNECLYGSWYPDDQNICFAYEDGSPPICWTFWLRDGALVALSVLAEPGAEVYEVNATDEPLPCPGPDIGV